MSKINGQQVQVQLNEVSIKSTVATFDLIESKSNYLESLSIYTSLFSPFIRMTLIINDYFDIIKDMKLIGNEEVSVRFKYFNTNKDQNPIKFRINSILDPNKLTSDKSGTMIIDCICFDYQNFYINVSKKLKGKSDTIFNDLIKNIVKSDSYLFFEKGTNELELQSNFNSVLDCINLICKHDNKFFYQDLDGYYSKSLNQMLSEPNKGNILFLVNQRDWIYSDVAKSYKFDYWNNQVLLENNVIHPHYINLDKDRYMINQIDKKFSDIGKSNYFKDLETPKHITNVYGNLSEKMDRQISSYNLNTNTITIKLNGNENRRIGDKIIVQYKGKDEIDKNHPLYHGEWLVTEIRNEMAISDYIQTIKLAKIKYTNLKG